MRQRYEASSLLLLSLFLQPGNIFLSTLSFIPWLWETWAQFWSTSSCRYALGSKPPAPSRTFRNHWDTRCESEWNRAYFLFALGQWLQQTTFLCLWNQEQNCEFLKVLEGHTWPHALPDSLVAWYYENVEEGAIFRCLQGSSRNLLTLFGPDIFTLVPDTVDWMLYQGNSITIAVLHRCHQTFWPQNCFFQVLSCLLSTSCRESGSSMCHSRAWASLRLAVWPRPWFTCCCFTAAGRPTSQDTPSLPGIITSVWVVCTERGLNVDIKHMAPSAWSSYLYWAWSELFRQSDPLLQLVDEPLD